MAPSSTPRTRKVTGTDGVYFFGIDIEPYEFECEVLVQGTDRVDLWKKVREVNGWIKTREPKKLVLDDEPDLYYKAICVNALDFDEIIEFGKARIRFFAVDPFAFGETVEQRVSSPAATFERTGTRYRNDGTVVTENYPVYRNGKFNEAVVIEEGTTNLLTSASNPVVQELSLPTTNHYYLTTIDGTAKIEHKMVENTTIKSLQKEGTDYSRSQTNFENTGTHTNTTTNRDGYLVLDTTGDTMTIDHDDDADFDGTHDGTATVNDTIRLAKVGTDFTVTEDSNVDFAQGDLSGFVVVDGDSVKLDTPTWSFSDDMSDWQENWTSFSPTTESLISQESNYTRINVPTAQATHTGIQYSNASVDFPATIAFRARVSGTVRIILENGNSYLYTDLPTSANYAWYYIRFINSTTVNVYLNGVLRGSLPTLSNPSTTQRLMIYVPISTTGSIDIDHVYMDWEDKGAPPMGNMYDGTYQSIAYDLGDLVEFGGKNHTLDFVNLTADNSGNIDIQFETGTVDPDTNEITWDYDDLVDIGDPTENRVIRFTVNFFTTDPGGQVVLNAVDIDFFSSFESSGTYESSPINVSSLKRIGESSIVWSTSNEFFGSVDVDVAISQDGGSSWSSWIPVSNSSNIPDVENIDLTNGRIKYRVSISTNIPSISPLLNSIEFKFTSNAYKTSGTYVTNAMDISTVGKAASSYQDWVSTEPSGTNVTVESRLSTDEGNSWTSWVPVTAWGAIPDITQTTDLSNARLQYRFNLTTTDTFVTPTVSYLEVVLTSGYQPSQMISFSPISVDSIGNVSSSLITWEETKPPNTDIIVEYSLDDLIYQQISKDSDFISGDLTGKNLYLRYTLLTDDTNVTPTIGNTITWWIAQTESNKIKPATGTIVLTPTGVTRWQLEEKEFGTGWQAYGQARNDESMSVGIHGLKGNGNVGAIDLWIYETGFFGQDKIIFQSEDDAYPIELKATTDNKYKATVNDVELVVPAPTVGWHHVGISWNQTDVSLYLDGVKVDQGTSSSPITTGSADFLFVGCSKNKTNQWNSMIDDLVISYVARDDSYFDDRYNATEGAPVSTDTSVYTFDNSLAAKVESEVFYKGTAPTYPIFKVTFIDDASYFRISNGSEYVQFNRNFHEGDELIIDCEKEVAMYNTSIPLAMEYLDLDSDFFKIKPNDVIVVDPSSVTIVDAEFTERWM